MTNDQWNKPATSGSSLVIGHWSLVIGHWSLVIGHWSFLLSVSRQQEYPVLLSTAHADDIVRRDAQGRKLLPGEFVAGIDRVDQQRHGRLAAFAGRFFVLDELL